jgi:predicted transposase YbfD/YdcC
LDQGHGRIELRQIATTQELNDFIQFPHVRQVARIERQITQKKSGKTTIEIAYVVTSLSPEKASPEQLLALVRGHWKIESQHWIRDMAFDEDRCRIRTGTGARMMATLRNLAIGLIHAAAPNEGFQKILRELAANSYKTLGLIGA